MLEAGTDDIKHSQRMVKAGGGSSSQAAELLDLFVNHIPPVPRKQIRTAELVLLLLGMAQARNCDQRIKLLPLAKLTMLQLFAPDLYRFGRRRYRGFIQTLQEWADKHENWGQRGFGEILEKKYKQQGGDKQPLSESQQIEARNFDRFYSPLIEALEASAHNRSGFDPFQFLKSHPLQSEDLKNLRLYFSFVDEATSPKSGNKLNTGIQDSEKLPIADLANRDEFLDLLFSESEGSWQSAVQMPELEGRVLDDKTFAVVLERLGKNDFKAYLQKSECSSYLYLLAGFGSTIRCTQHFMIT